MKNLTFYNEIDGSGGENMAASLERAAAGAMELAGALAAVGTGAAVFEMMTDSLRAVDEAFSRSVRANRAYQAELSALKGALRDAFEPIFSYILPGLLALMRIVGNVFSLIGSLFGKVSGADPVKEKEHSVRGLRRSIKQAKKDLAEFDEIHRLGQSDADSGGAGGGGGAGWDGAAYRAQIDELTVYLSGALLALGAILTFSGANVPLGLALMALGAAGLASAVTQNWGNMSDSMRLALTRVFTLLAAAALVIGGILAFSGANIPLGIGLMAAGAAGLAMAAALNWNTVTDALRGQLGVLVAAASGALLALGLILICTGANIPLGVALMAAGAVGLVSVAALNWDAILKKLQGVWAEIKAWFEAHVKPKLTLSYWKEQFSNIATALKEKVRDGINAAIALMNKFIGWVNDKMTLKWGDFSVGGKQVIAPGSFQLLRIPTIPALARGAVLPANRPFLSIVGDQKSGTNVEAPLTTIQEALSAVLKEYNPGVSIRFTGDLAQLARVLKPVIDTESQRVGTSLAVRGGSL